MKHRVKIEVPCESPGFGIIKITCSASFPAGQEERAKRLAADAVNELVYDIDGNDHEGFRNTA